MGVSALAIATIRPGTRGCVGGANTWSTPSGTTRDPGRVDPEVGHHVARGGRRRADDVPDPSGHCPLHPQEAVPAPQGEAPAPGRRRGQVDAAVEGDRVVDRRHQGEPGPLEPQDPVAQRLVVVHHVEVGEPLAEHALRAEAEGARLGEAGRPHRADLQQVDAVPDLAGARRAERVGLAVEVEARDLGQPHARVEHGVGLAGEHLHVVAEGDQLAAEVTDVDALATAVRLAAVGQQGDAHPTSGVGGTCSHRDGFALLA